MASLDEILYTEANHLKKNAFLSRKLDAKKFSTTQNEADPVFQLRSKQTRDLAFNASLQRKLRACEAVRRTEVCKSPPRATVSVGGKPTITDADVVLIKSNLLCQDSPVKLSSTVQPEPPALPRRRVTENCLIKSSEQLAGLKKLPATGSELCEQFEGMKIRCKAADMVVVMQEHALRFAHQAVFSSQKLQFKMIAHLLKKEFDQTYGPAWHCIAGSSFGSYVTHSVGGFFYFSVGKVSILLFKTTVEVVDHK